MMARSIDSIIRHGLGDHRLRELRWTRDGEDLHLVLAKPGGELVTLKARWATEVRVDIDFGSHFGEPLVFGSSIEASDDGGFRLRVDFGAAPDGFLALRCTGLELD